MLAAVEKLPHVTSVTSPFDPNAGTRISEDGTIGFATVTFDEKPNALPISAIKAVISRAQSIESDALQVELGGQAIEQTEFAPPSATTGIGVLAAVIVLLISFGSFLAMGLPIVTALFGLGTGIGLIGLTSHAVGMPSFSIELAAMIGLGVGIDYALFILTRYRETYHENGGEVKGAVELAMDTAGRAVVFAGITVVIALLGMFALGVSFLYGLAIAASLAVLLVLLASITLLPALLTFFGHKVGQPGRLARLVTRKRKPKREGPGFWARWVGTIQRHPKLAATAALSVMLLLAAPALWLRLGSSDAGNDPASFTTRHAYDLLAQGFGPGFNGPLTLVVQLPELGRHLAAHRDQRRRLEDSRHRRGRAAPRQPFRRRRDHQRLSEHLSREREDPRSRRAAPPRGAPAARIEHRLHDSRRRRDRRVHRLLERPLGEALVLHRDRRRALGAAPARRLPLAADPAPGGGDEPALDRGLARRLRDRLPVRLVPRASPPGRSTRSCRC